MVKKLVVLVLLAAVAIVIFQLFQYFSHYGKATSVLDRMVLRYWETDRDDFRRDLVDELRALGFRLELTDIEVEEVSERREVTVRVHYRTNLNILFVSIERAEEMDRTSRDVDFGP